MGESPAFVGLLSGCGVLALVAIVLGFLHSRRERMLTHAERMKALELGRPLPEDPATARLKAAMAQPVATSEEGEPESLARKCYSTALWVAFWGFTAVTGSVGFRVDTIVSCAIAASVGAIGVTSMICGTILAAKAPATTTRTAIKSEIDEDVFDVVSSRG